MSRNEKSKLVKTYRKYSAMKKKRSVLDFLRVQMIEIIFRTTRLEGERISRKMVSSLFR